MDNKGKERVIKGEKTREDIKDRYEKRIKG